VTLSANLLAAQVKRHPIYDYRIITHTETSCEIVFYQDGKESGSSTFTMADAKAAGLGGVNWQKYPRNMLFARAISNGVKWHCPDVMSGMPVYTPDELNMPVDGETGNIVEGVATEIKESVLPPISYDAATVAAVIEAGLTENAFSFTGAIKKADLDADVGKETVLAWFKHYRAARDANASSDEAAIQANAWWEGEGKLNLAMTYTTDSGKVLGKLSPDQLAEMVTQIDGLEGASPKMLTIREHCLMLIDYLAS